MHYKIAIGSMPKTALPKLENQHFHECQLLLWPILLDQTTNTQYTFSGHTAVGNSAHWLHLSTFPPVEDTLPRIPQASSKPDKTVRP